MIKEVLVKTLITEALQNGGVTISLDGTRPTTGYAVGGQAPGVTFPIEESFRSESEDSPNAYQVTSNWIDRTTSLVLPDFYVGSWLDQVSGQVWIDVVRVFEEFAPAKKEAIQRGELALFDLTTGKEIRFDSPQTQLAAYLARTVGIVTEQA